MTQSGFEVILHNGERADLEHITQKTLEEVRSVFLFGGWIDVPTLSNDKDYVEWFSHQVYNPDNVYKVFEVIATDVRSQGFSIYRVTGDRFLRYETDTILYLWQYDSYGSGMVAQAFEKTDKGLVYLDDPNVIPFKKYITDTYDFYKHPGNQPIHSLDFLFSAPVESYLGKDIYYDPTHHGYILVRNKGKWSWHTLSHILIQPPTAIEEEVSLVRSLFLS